MINLNKVGVGVVALSMVILSGCQDRDTSINNCGTCKLEKFGYENVEKFSGEYLLYDKIKHKIISNKIPDAGNPSIEEDILRFHKVQKTSYIYTVKEKSEESNSKNKVNMEVDTLSIKGSKDYKYNSYKIIKKDKNCMMELSIQTLKDDNEKEYIDLSKINTYGYIDTGNQSTRVIKVYKDVNSNKRVLLFLSKKEYQKFKDMYQKGIK